MKINARCAECLMEKQRARSSDPAYLAEVQSLLDQRTDRDCSPFMVYLFDQAFARRFGRKDDYGPVKRQYNDLVLNMEGALRARVEAAPPVGKGRRTRRPGRRPWGPRGPRRPGPPRRGPVMW